MSTPCFSARVGGTHLNHRVSSSTMHIQQTCKKISMINLLLLHNFVANCVSPSPQYSKDKDILTENISQTTGQINIDVQYSASSLWHIRSKMRIPHIAACQLIEPSQVCPAKCLQMEMAHCRALKGNVLWLVSFHAHHSLPAHLTIHLRIYLTVGRRLVCLIRYLQAACWVQPVQ